MTNYILLALFGLFYSLAGLTFAIAASLSYLSEIISEQRFFGIAETFEFAQAIMISFIAWPIFAIQVRSINKEKANPPTEPNA